MVNKKGITLIGMPGSGKSTIGKLLAASLGWRFLDLDIHIKDRTGRSHSEILEEKGDREFIQLEGDLALDLDYNRLVFSPGGSIVYSDSAMEKIRNETEIFYLVLPVSEIRKRLGSGIHGRGIVGLKGRGLDRLFEERDVLYRKYADRILDCSGLDKNDIVNLISENLK